MSISAYYKQISQSDLEKILTETGSTIFDVVWQEANLKELKLVKACEAIFFLLAGHDKTDGSPYAMAIFGRSQWKPGEGYFNKDDGIYYGSCYLTSPDVHEIAAALTQFSKDVILQRFVKNDFEVTWGQPEDIIMPYFRELTLFYSEASNKGKSVLIKIT